MIIKPESTIVVYENKVQKYFKSVYSNFEVLFQEYKMVGYIEELGVLCCGFDTVYYDMNLYVNDIMNSDFEEMRYEDYILYYQNKLEKDNPGAPSLNEFPLVFPNVQVNEFGQENITRTVLNSNPVLSNLSKHGVNVQILKG